MWSKNLQVLNHFEKLSVLRSDSDEEPKPKATRLVGSILVGLCVMFAVNSVICLATGEFGVAVGVAVASTVFGCVARDSLW